MKIQIHKKIYQKWIDLSYRGITEDLTIEEAVKTRLINIMSLTLFAWSITLFLLVFFVGKKSHLLVIAISFIFQIILFFLNITKRQLLARYLIMIAFSIYIPVFWIFVDSNWRTDFIFLIIIFLTLILFTGKRQIILLIFECFACLAPKFIEPLVPDIYKMNIAPLPYITEYTYVVYAFFSGILLNFYQSEIKKYRKNLSVTIADLQKSNAYLKRVSNELEQFLHIISSGFKNQLQVIDHQVEKMNTDLETQHYLPILQSLELANFATKEMYFWVNDVLEFSNYNKNKARTTKTTNCNEIINYVTINLTQIYPNLSKRIQIENLPMLKINDVEAFIVFYNLMKIMLQSSNENSVLIVKSHQVEKNWIIRFESNYQNSDNANTSNKDLALKFNKLLVEGWNGTIKPFQAKQKNNGFELKIPADSN